MWDVWGLGRYVEILTVCTGAQHDTEPGLTAANICFFLENWSAVKMKCLTFLFVMAVGGVGQLHTEQTTALLSLLSPVIVHRLVLHLSTHLVCCLLPGAAPRTSNKTTSSWLVLTQIFTTTGRTISFMLYTSLGWKGFQIQCVLSTLVNSIRVQFKRVKTKLI